MKPIHFEGVTTIIGEHQPEYYPLPAKVEILKSEPGTLPWKNHTVVLELSEAEREMIARHGKLTISQMGYGFNPLQIDVKDYKEGEIYVYVAYDKIGDIHQGTIEFDDGSEDVIIAISFKELLDTILVKFSNINENSVVFYEK